MPLDPIPQGSTHTPVDIAWTRATDGAPQDLTGATLTGLIIGQNGTTRLITGTLVALAPTTSGIVRWFLSAPDVATIGIYLIRITATYADGLSDATYSDAWQVVGYQTATYDLSTNIGRVRALIPDRPINRAVFTPADDPLFSDDEITMFVAFEVGLKRAVALALETIATDEALVQKVMTVQSQTQSIETNGAATAKAILQRAAALRQQAQDEEDREEGGAFDIAEMPGTAFAERDRLYKQGQRGQY